MIKNIIFDIGKVLIRWEPTNMCLSFCPDRATAERVCSSTYLAKRWAGLDAGDLNIAQAIEESVGELGEAYRKYITAAYNSFVFLAEVIDDGLSLAKRFKAERYTLYLASNFNENVYPLAERLRLNDIFSGHIFSFEEKITKPNPEFFVRLAKRYSLNLKECAFIDDNADNVKSACSLGIAGFVYCGNADEIYGKIKGM